MPVDIPADALYVPTDEEGRQVYEDETTRWSPPSGGGGDGGTGGAVADTGPSGPHLLDLDALLDDLGARIFVATESPSGPRLVAETAWSSQAAARFALDCAERLLGDSGAVPSEIARTLSEIVKAARGSLDQAVGTNTGLLGRFSRRSLARRLRHQGDQVGNIAFDFAVDAEVAEVDIFDDPAWTAAAATRDAVLAAVEAIRHEAMPHFAEDSARETEKELSEDTGRRVDGTFDTPWGPFHAGMGKVAVPPWAAAQEAAERARQSVADAGGGAEDERAWQRERLLQALRGA